MKDQQNLGDLRRVFKALKFHPSNVLAIRAVLVRFLARLILQKGSMYNLFKVKYKVPYEPFIYPYLRGRHNEVLDIGANVGQHTRYLAKISRLVVAIEPEPNNFLELCNRLEDMEKKVCLLNMAVSDRDGYATLHLTKQIDGHSLVRTTDTVSKVTVKTKTIDSLCFSMGLNNVTLIKMDTEGAEHLVIRGAKKTLLHQKPRLVIEFHDNYDEVIWELDQIGYGFSLIQPRNIFDHPKRGYIYAYRA